MSARSSSDTDLGGNACWVSRVMAEAWTSARAPRPTGPPGPACANAQAIGGKRPDGSTPASARLRRYRDAAQPMPDEPPPKASPCAGASRQPQAECPTSPAVQMLPRPTMADLHYGFLSSAGSGELDFS